MLAAAFLLPHFVAVALAPPGPLLPQAQILAYTSCRTRFGDGGGLVLQDV